MAREDDGATQLGMDVNTAVYDPPAVHLVADDFTGRGRAAQEVLRKRQQLPGVSSSTDKFKELRLTVHNFASNMGRIQGPPAAPPRDTLAYYKTVRAVVKAKICEMIVSEEARCDDESSWSR